MKLLRDMNMNSEDELIKAFALLEPAPPLVLEYRLHYDDKGNITMCTMANHPENTQYLIVTKTEYDNYFRYRVVNHKLKLVDINSGFRVQLTKSNSGYKTVKNHAALVLEANETYQDIEYYDTVN